MLDLTTLIGLLIGIGALVFGVLDAGGSSSEFINKGALAIILGGAAGATICQFQWSDIVEFPRVAAKVIWHRAADPGRIVRDLVRYAEIARKDGILALEGVAEEIKDPFIVKGLQLAIDGTDPEVINQMMTTELEYTATRHELGRKFFESLSLFFPAFGLVGTLTGMIMLLARSQGDASKLQPALSQALTATLYGMVGCYVLFNPLAKKLEVRSREELMLKEMIIRGILSIQSGDNPRIVEQKLKIFLPPKFREAMERGEA